MCCIVFQNQSLQAWTRPISPPGSTAVVFVNLGDGGSPVRMSTPLTKLGLNNKNGYNITETFDGIYMGKYHPMDNFICNVNPNGVFMIIATPLQ